MQAVIIVHSFNLFMRRTGHFNHLLYNHAAFSYQNLCSFIILATSL